MENHRWGIDGVIYFFKSKLKCSLANPSIYVILARFAIIPFHTTKTKERHAASFHLNTIRHMGTAVILTFIIGYLAIVFEHPLKLDKTVPALIMAALCWAFVSLGHVDLPVGHTAHHGVGEHDYY